MTDAPCIFPTLRFRDSAAMLDWLKSAFGFAEHAVYRDGDAIAHAELRLGSSIIMIGQTKDDEYGRLVGSPESRRTDAIYIAVPDADATHARAEKAGAVIVQPLRDTEYNSREFTCRDPEGNLWASVLAALFVHPVHVDRMSGIGFKPALLFIALPGPNQRSLSRHQPGWWPR